MHVYCAAVLALQQPVPLVGLLKGLVDPVVGQGRVRELVDFLQFAVPHPLHGHVNSVLMGLVQLIEDNEVGRHGFEAHPGCHPAKVQKAVPNAFDVRRVGVLQPLAYGVRVILDEPDLYGSC